MNRLGLYLLFGAIIVLQLFIGQTGGGVSPNLALACLVLLCAFLPLEQMLIMALLGGVVLDGYSGAVFGLHISYYILAVLLAKLVFRLGEKNQSFVLSCGVAVLLLVLFSFIDFASIFSSGEITRIVQDLPMLGLDIVVNAIFVGLLYAGIAFISNSATLSGIARRNTGGSSR